MFERFIGRKVKIRMKNNFFYEGIVEEVTKDRILLNDRLKGEMILDLASISMIVHADENVSR